MNQPRQPLFDLVQENHDRESYAALHWSGSFRDYLAIAERNPGVARNAWQRLYDMIEYHGSQPAGSIDGSRSLKRYKVFDDPFENGREAVFGLDESLRRACRRSRGRVPVA
jgi:serine protein kinase